MTNEKDRRIINFMNEVGWYISMEYGSSINNEYIKYWHDKDFLNNTLYDFIGSYYIAGKSIPDTARYVVALTKQKIQDKNM
jgi:hypothetical protein